MELVNLTPFPADRFIALDGRGRESLLVVIKATFTITPGSPAAALADEQDPLVAADEYLGEPGRSSLRQASDLAPFKPATDILVSGCAYARNGGKASEAMVGLRIGGLQKGIQVFGDRIWHKVLFSTEKSAPVPFTRMPLTFERAFGGTDATAARPDHCAANPVGRGFRAGSGSKLPVEDSHLPNCEDPQDLIVRPTDRPRPMGLGPVAPSWAPRAGFAGTFDPAWREQRMPLPPLDFDPRFHQAAPPDQVYPGYVAGGEPVTIAGTRPEGGFHFTLPRTRPRVTVLLGGQRETPPAPCDTVSIDCERGRLSLTWRATVDVHGRIDALHWLKIDGEID